MIYQPIYAVGAKRIFAYEALLRSEARAFPHPGAILDAARGLHRLSDVLHRVTEAVSVDAVAGDSHLVFHFRDTGSLFFGDLRLAGEPGSDLWGSLIHDVLGLSASAIQDLKSAGII